MENNFTLSAFAEPITALPDTPNLSASELKRRFQAPSDELREVHNALAKTVQGITDATYPETVSENMLTEDLAGKINGKAEQRDMTAVQKDVALHTQQISGLCSLHFGTYTGNGAESREIDLGFAPKAVLVLYQGYQSYSNGGMHYGGLSVVGKNAAGLELTDNGFRVKYYGYVYLNRENHEFTYIAFA